MGPLLRRFHHRASSGLGSSLRSNRITVWRWHPFPSGTPQISRAPVLGSDDGESPNPVAQPADAEGRIPEPPLRRKIFSHIVRPSQTSMIAMESTLSLSDAKARFSEIVDRAINGEDFVITRMGRPAVRISRFETHPRSRKLGDLAGQIRMSEDFEEWPPDLREALGMEPTK